MNRMSREAVPVPIMSIFGLLMLVKLGLGLLGLRLGLGLGSWELIF
jgi:hypothetical protein